VSASATIRTFVLSLLTDTQFGRCGAGYSVTARQERRHGPPFAHGQAIEAHIPEGHDALPELQSVQHRLTYFNHILIIAAA
jgi:hypothetical protein